MRLSWEHRSPKVYARLNWEMPGRKQLSPLAGSVKVCCGKGVTLMPSALARSWGGVHSNRSPQGL